jgi:hypothetical protein
VSLQGNGIAPYSVGAGSGGSLSATVTSGSTATYNLQLNGSAGFSGNVSLSCSGAPIYANCTVSPSSVALTSGGSGSFTVTVTTQTTTTSALATHSRLELAGGLLALFLLPFVSLRKRAAYLPLFGLALALLCAGWGITGCGGGPSGGSGGSGKTQTFTTPKGNYPLTISATSGSTTSTQTLTLIVN